MARAVQDRRRSPALPEEFRRAKRESRRRGRRKATTTARIAESTLMAMDGKNYSPAASGLWAQICRMGTESIRL